MIEIMNNGPVAIAVNAEYDLLLYDSGIYQHYDEQTWLIKEESRPEW